MNDGTGNDMDMNYVDAVMNVNLDMNDPFLASLDPKTARLASELDFPLSGLTGLGPNAVSTEDFDLSNFLSLPSHYPSHASTTSSDATFSQQQQQLQPQQQQYPRSPFDQPLTPESSDAGPSSRSNSTLGSSMVFDPAHCPTNAEELKHYKPMGPGGTVYNKLVLEPVSLAAAPSIQKVVYQLCAHAFDNTSVPRPLSAFDDLPPLPDAYILNELIAVYFERLPPIIPIVHEAAFYRSASEPVTPDSYTDIRPKPPFHHNPPRRGLSPALLYSMFSCAARYHPYYQGQTELVEKTFYERARRLAAASFDNPNLNLLKTFLHLTLYTVEHSMWMPSYMMLGNGVMMARYLGLYKELPSIPVQPQPLPGQQPDEELLDGLSPNEVAAEECRRCWWWVRNYDASGSAASKRPQMISDSEYASTLLLPCPDSLFYAGRYGLRPNAPSVPRTLTLDEFFSPAFSAHVAYSNIGPNGYIACLTALFNRVTHFRQTCKTMNILPFAPGNDMRGQQVFVEIREHQQQLDTWYSKLPQWVKILDSGVRAPNDPIVGGANPLCWSVRWQQETYEWGIALVTYHATVATLHGPDYNMMTMGHAIVGAVNRVLKYDAPPHIATGYMNAARMDEVLSLWQGSESFGISAEHAASASRLLEEMAVMVEERKRRDTPFFGYCVCQVGLLNLIAARQSAIHAARQKQAGMDSQADVSLTMSFKQRAGTTIEIMRSQAPFFSASETGLKLLERGLNDISAGEITFDLMNDMEGMQQGDREMKEMIVRRAMGSTAKEVLEEPEKCAGTSGATKSGTKFGTVL